MTRILLADDVKLYLALEKTFLARSDHEFLTATSGSDALSILRASPPDLAIVERAMGGMGALEIRAAMMADAALSRVPMIMTTSVADDDVRRRAGDLGISAVLLKPFTLEDLTTAVQRVLPSRSRRFPRIDVYVDVGLRTEKHVQYLTGGAINVSACGLLVELSDPLSLGQVVSLQFVLPTDPKMIAARGRVVRYAKEQHRTGMCYGFELVDLADDDRARLERFVALKGARALEPA